MLLHHTTRSRNPRRSLSSQGSVGSSTRTHNTHTRKKKGRDRVLHTGSVISTGATHTTTTLSGIPSRRLSHDTIHSHSNAEEYSAESSSDASSVVTVKKNAATATTATTSSSTVKSVQSEDNRCVMLDEHTPLLNV